LNAIREDRTPNLLLMRYALATWEVRDLLLIPSFMFSESAVIKRPPLAATARRAGWVGCNIDLHRIAPEARIAIVITRSSPAKRDESAPSSSGESRESQSRLTSAATIIVPPEEVRAKYKRVKPLENISVTQRGWTLDVLNIVAAALRGRDGALRRPRPKRAQDSGGFTAGDIAARCPYQQLHDLRRLCFRVRIGKTPSRQPACEG
jgi:hypothetical protein